jgi:hypothetical protein
LILIDELGRATSNEDGVAIAWSVSEFLLAKRSMTFFVTHYPQLAKLSEVYSGVQNQHMGASIDSEKNGEVLYFHKLMPGACSASSDYGVEMSASCGWPDDVVQLVGYSPPEQSPPHLISIANTSRQRLCRHASFDLRWKRSSLMEDWLLSKQQLTKLEQCDHFRQPSILRLSCKS